MQVTWKEVGQVPLCLLTPDMQNRRIIDRALRSVGAEATPTLTSNSLLVLYTHVKTGRWASVMPAKLAETLGLADTVRSIPIVDPVVDYSIGLVIPQRDPMTPLIAALVQVAREVAPTLEDRAAAMQFARDQAAAGHLRLSALRASRGSVIRRRRCRLPSFERSRIEPPCRLVSERAIARPSPEP